jgi:aspartate beta-hydroxylase
LPLFSEIHMLRQKIRGLSMIDVARLLKEAVEAQRAGQVPVAERLYNQVLKSHPEHPAALNSLGMMALASERHSDARGYFQRAAKADSKAPELHINIGTACRQMGDDEGEQAALLGALALDQRYFVALLRLAELHERRGEHGQAVERWTSVLTLATQTEGIGPDLQKILDHGSAYLADQRRVLSDALDGALASDLSRLEPAQSRRFEACVDKVLGRRKIFNNECAGIHFPFLPADEFFDRHHFPWFAELEAQTGVIRGEFEAMLATNTAAIKPYVAMDSGMPNTIWTALDHSPAWGAVHLWRHGVPDPEACALCPRTAEIVASMPLSDIPGRTPTVFFSILRPGTHLPPHTGVSNTRAVVHLPLIVPSKCGLRVGGETREWKVGEAFAFDDTIEHEAWNKSDELRAILILDVWNPHISSEERALLRTFFEVADRTASSAATQVSD